MNMVRLSLFAVLVMITSGLSSVVAQEDPPNLPAGFRLIGYYQLKSKMKVENGEAMPVVISPLKYRVYSDGIEVRVYCRTAGEESYTSYQIYRSDGIGVAKPSGELQVIAGVQGLCEKGDMIRQISVTRASLTMVKMPPRSHRVIVTRAIAASPSDKAPKTK